MANFGISKATIGYDTAGIAKMLTNIKANVILTAAKKMNTNLSNLNNAVDRIWAGKAAETFKSNMAGDVKKIKKALDDSYNVLESEVNSIVNAMGRLDQELVKKR